MTEYGTSLAEIENEWTDPMLLLFVERITERRKAQQPQPQNKKTGKLSLAEFVERAKT